jgi:ubiquitin carboxyl-terminal hydrolase 14
VQRRVKFPLELDALELCTPELREKMLPVSRRLKEIEKDRAERRKVRKRTKTAAASEGKPSHGEDVEMAEASSSTPEGADLENENVYRERELKELEALVDPELKKDVGSSVAGLFELVGE